MKQFVMAALMAASLWMMASGAQAQRRPSFADKPLDTSKRLYVRPSGTRVFSDPAPPRRRVWRYRRNDGRVVTKVTGATRAQRKRAPHKVVRRSKRRKR